MVVKKRHIEYLYLTLDFVGFYLICYFSSSESVDADGNGSLDLEEFADAYRKINPDVSMVQLEAMFQEADIDGNGTLDLEEVSRIGILMIGQAIPFESC